MKKNTRNKLTYPGLDKSKNLKIRQELIDFDYLDKLNPKEKQWLSNFMQEYVAADFRHEGKKFHKSKKKRKCVFDANNHRNVDSFSVTKSNGMLKTLNGSDFSKKGTDNLKTEEYLSSSLLRSTLPNETEDTIIKVLDYINEKKTKKV